MSLREKQAKFTRMVALLIQYAYERGYEITLGDAWAKTGHSSKSLHYDRLAIDLNLFRDGKWLSKTEDHEPLGVFWESIGGSWGGRFNKNNFTPHILCIDPRNGVHNVFSACQGSNFMSYFALQTNGAIHRQGIS